MDYLKEIFGEDALTYDEFTEKVKKSDKVKLANLKDGRYVDKNKFEAKEKEVETLQEQLETANKQIEDFKEMDIDAIKQAAEDYKAKYETEKANAQKELEKLQFEHAIEKALTGAKAKNAKAVRALLDLDGLKLNNGEIVGLNEQLEKIKEENDYLFEGEEEKVPQIVKSGGDDTKTSSGVLNISKLAEEASIRK